MSLAMHSAPAAFLGIAAEAMTQAQPPVIDTGCLIVGGGPAGLAPLLAASRSLLLARILGGGVVVAEQGPTIGPGSIGNYAITSDSTAETLLNCIQEPCSPLLATLRNHPAALAVAAYGHGAVPLKLVGGFMAALGGVLHTLLEQRPGCAVLPGHMALQTQQMPDGGWCTELRRLADGAVQRVHSQTVVLATGGHQPAARLAAYHAGGVQLLPRYAAKLVQSDTALTASGLAGIARRLAAGTAKSVAIIGSSSSAIATANAILRLPRGVCPDRTRVTVVHRRPLRIFYPSAAAALAEGYDEFGPDDICPVSGFVFRFAGFRLESRELVMAARGIGGRRADKRLLLHQLRATPDGQVKAILDKAEVIVVAIGYRPLALPVLGASGEAIPLQADAPGERPLVDHHCHVLDDAGTPIPGLLGIGLATGFMSQAASGGEASFSGQTNGLWQWQNEVGEIIARQLGEVLERKALLF